MRIKTLIDTAAQTYLLLSLYPLAHDEGHSLGAAVAKFCDTPSTVLLLQERTHSKREDTVTPRASTCHSLAQGGRHVYLLGDHRSPTLKNHREPREVSAKNP